MARCFGFVLVLSIVEVYELFDQDDSLIFKLFFQVFFPTTIMTTIGFGLMDELYFKLKLYDPDEHNRSVIDTMPTDDPFRDFRVNISERGSSQPYTKRDITALNADSLLGSKDS